MRWERMRRVLKGKRQEVEFCDACGSVCDARCRSRRQREAARRRALELGPRL